MLRVCRRGIVPRLGPSLQQLSCRGAFTASHALSSFSNVNGHIFQSQQQHSSIRLTNGSLSNRPSSRSFTADTNDTTNGNGNSIESSKHPLWSVAGKHMARFNMDDKKYLKAVKPFWSDIVSMAKSGETQFRDIEATLMHKCEFSVSDAFIMAHWFVDNFNETQKRYELPTEHLDPAKLFATVYEREYILNDVSKECDKRRDYLSKKHSIPRERIDSLLPYDLKKNIDGLNFHLRGLQSLDSMYPSFVKALGGPGRVVGILGPRGISKTSTVLSLAHKDTKKEYQHYVIYKTAHGVVPDGNVSALTRDIGLYAQPYPQSKWGTVYSQDEVKQNLERCYQTTQYFVNCDALARVLLLRLLIDKGNELLTPHFHQQLQFSKQGDVFVSKLYHYLTSFSAESVEIQLNHNLKYVVEQLDYKVISVLDEALHAMERFNYLISLPSLSRDFRSLFNHVTGMKENKLTGGAGNPAIPPMEIRGWLANDYRAYSKYMTFVAVGTGLRVENLYFALSGKSRGGQVRQLEIFDYFNLLTWEQVKNHLRHYPPFVDALEKFLPGIEEQIWRPRDVEIALHNFYQYNDLYPSAYDALVDAKAIIKQDVEFSISKYIGAVTDEELEDIVSNTLETNGACITGRETPRYCLNMHVRQKLFDCNLGVIPLGHNQYRLQEPGYLGNLLDSYSERLDNICKIQGMIEREKMLSIDGGGASGIVPLRVLNFIEKHLSNDKKIINVFDRIVGTSAGGIISLGLMAGLNTDELTDAYMELSAAIFGNNKLDMVVRGLCDLKEELRYPNILRRLMGFGGGSSGGKRTDALEESLVNTIKRMLTGDVIGRPMQSVFLPKNGEMPKVIVPSVYVSKNQEIVEPIYFSNYLHGNDVIEGDIITAMSETSAIMNLFEKQSELIDENGHFVDSGYLCNNPSWKGYEFAHRENKQSIPSLILSLGCGATDEQAKRRQLSRSEQFALYGFGGGGISHRLNYNTESTHLAMQETFKSNSPLLNVYHRIDPILGSHAVSVAADPSTLKRKIPEIDAIIEKEYASSLEHAIQKLELY